MSDDVELFLEEKRWEREIAAASPVVRAWCERFLNGAILSARPTIYERAGYGLAHLAPAHLRTTSFRSDKEMT